MKLKLCVPKLWPQSLRGTDAEASGNYPKSAVPMGLGNA